jgi:ATP-dependent DNA helicase DinG
MISFAEGAGEQEAFDLASMVDSIFREGGWMEKALGFEYRPEQHQMAQSVARSLLSDSHLLFEAGTGVGKSLAYLVPSVLFARSAKRPCVVATNTISLQEQLLNKDIPALRTLMESTPEIQGFGDFRCALLVGRANYLCATRLHRALSGQGELFEGVQRRELERIVKWANEGAAEGIRQELSPSAHGRGLGCRSVRTPLFVRRKDVSRTIVFTGGPGRKWRRRIWLLLITVCFFL